MTHYTVNYEGLKPLEKQIKAVRDIQGWLGEDKFKSLTATFKRELGHITGPDEYRLDIFCLWVSFVGVQGFPATAWFNYCFPQQSEEK